MKDLDNYKAWQIQEKDFPQEGTLKEQITFLIGYGILAPSTHNSQPWIFEIKPPHLYIAANSDRHLPAADPTGRNMHISLGACTFNIRVAAAHFGFSTEIKYAKSPDKNNLISLEFVKSTRPDKELSGLFPQIVRRYSEKRAVRGPTLGDKILNKLRDGSVGDAQVHLTNSRTKIDQLAKLCYQAASDLASSPSFAQELSAWLRSNKTSEYDGMPGFSSGHGSAKVLVAKALMKRTAGILRPMSKKYSQMVLTSPAVGIITTPTDTRQDWVRAGITYERLALVASAHGVSLSPMAVLVERPDRARLLGYFGKKDGYPQMFYRLVRINGPSLHTPRRPLARTAAETSIVKLLEREGVQVALHSQKIGRFNINYAIAGNGPALLLVHGANFGWGQWTPNLKQLSEHFKVIAVDLPGCGGSTPMDFTKISLAEYVQILVDLVKYLKCTSLNIVAHSFGGAVALKMATESDLKIDKLVLVNTMGFGRNMPGRQKLVSLHPFAKLLSKTAIKPTRKNIEKFLEEPLINHNAISPELVDYYWTAVRDNPHNHPMLFIHSLTSPLRIKRELLLLDDFARVKQPVLVIMGEKDPLMPLSKIKQQVARHPNARLEIFKNCGHVPSLEYPSKFNKSVVNFLK